MKFICTGGPYGDECSSYDIIFDNSCKVKDVIKEVLTQNEWGTISFHGTNIHTEVEYEKDKLLNEIEDYILEADVAKASAHGGWSLMDYTFIITNVNLPKKYYSSNVEPFIDF